MCRVILSFERISQWAMTMMGMALLWMLASTAQAQTGLKIRLVADVTTIQPGKPFSVGLFLQHDLGWHTYWKQPGIVGVPTSIAWELPEGFQAGELEYPEPQQVLMFRIRAQGYERDVLLQTRITPPADLKPGAEITLKGKAAWMACGNSCHPSNQELSLTLKVGDGAADAKWQPVFAKERATYPDSSPAWDATAAEEGKVVTLTLEPKSEEARRFTKAQETYKVVFFTEDGWINSDEPQKMEVTPQGGIKITLHRADVFLGKTTPTTLVGVVQCPDGWLSGEKKLRNLRIAPKIMRGGAL